MKKLLISLIIMLTAIFTANAKENSITAEIISIDDSNITLKVGKHNIKENDKIYIMQKSEENGVITAVNEEQVSINLKNNGFATGSKVIINHSSRLGKAGSQKAEVIKSNQNSIVLLVKNNKFKKDDKIKISINGDEKAVVNKVDKNNIIISSKNIGYAKGSIVVITKNKQGFKEKYNEKEGFKEKFVEKAK